MVFYPSSLPCVSKSEGLSLTAYAGVVRTPMEAGNSRQRRAQRVLPQALQLTWDIAQAQLYAWTAWVNAHAWDDWILLQLPGLKASSEGLNVSQVPVRFISDLTEELLPGVGLWFWRVKVTVEYNPAAAELTVPPITSDITAGTPATPSPDWIVAGSPGTPSPWTPVTGLALAAAPELVEAPS
jgi:hypothetical protein